MIKASLAAEVKRLVAALAGAEAVGRETATARLAIIGSRAVAQLHSAYQRTDDAPLKGRILRVLEDLADPRSLALAREALRTEPDDAAAAAQVLRALLSTGEPEVANQALEALVSVALDPTLPHPSRLAALEALKDMPLEMRAQVTGALSFDPDSLLREAVGTESAADQLPPADQPGTEAAPSAWERLLSAELPAAPHGIAALVASGGAVAPLISLQKLVDAVRARERQGDDGAAEWCALRGSLHQALALRGSRVALYDLRESLSAASAPLPVSFLAAVHEVGDSSCLDPLAMAYVKARPEEDWWRSQLAAALRAIIGREQLTRRSAVLKRLISRWPDAVAAAGVAPASRPSRTTPRRSKDGRT